MSMKTRRLSTAETGILGAVGSLGKIEKIVVSP
jgi:hypothetical protein